MGKAIGFENGTIVVHDPAAALPIIASFIRGCSDPGERRFYLSLATLCTQERYSSQAPILPSAAPEPLFEGVVIQTARLGVHHGDEDYLKVLAAYAGLANLRERYTLASLLYPTNANATEDAAKSARAARAHHKFMSEVLESPRPVPYLMGAVRRRVVSQSRQVPQKRMAELSIDVHHGEADGRAVGVYVPDFGVDATPGIDCDNFVAMLRASGKPADHADADDIESWIAGATKAELGDARYQRILYHLRQPRARAIAKRTRVVCPHAPGYGVMASPTWVYTNSGRVDSVWHKENAHLIR